MVSRARRKKLKESRRYSEKRFQKHLRHNTIYAQPGIHDFVVILDHLKPSFNIGKIFRTADAFGAHSVHLIGISYFDIKAAKGAFKWVPVIFHDTFDTCYATLRDNGYRFYLLDPGAQSALHTTDLPPKTCFIFGHEEFGISFEHECYDKISPIRVAQVGRMDSLNVSIAASIAMYEYSRQHASRNLVTGGNDSLP